MHRPTATTPLHPAGRPAPRAQPARPCITPSRARATPPLARTSSGDLGDLAPPQVRFFNNQVELFADRSGKVKDPNERFMHWRLRPVPRARPVAWALPTAPRGVKFPSARPRQFNIGMPLDHDAPRMRMPRVRACEARPATAAATLMPLPTIMDTNPNSWLDDLAASIARFREERKRQGG